MIRSLLLALIFIKNIAFAQGNEQSIRTDVLVIGGGAGGTAAAIQCARMGVKTILVEETTMLGGMLTAAGVSCTDGNNELPSGIWEEFRQALQKHYGKKFLNTGWVSWTNFEPHVGDSIFKSWAANEKNLSVQFKKLCIQVIKLGNKVTGALFTDMQQNLTTIHAKIIVDGTELGDIMAKAGAAYDLGMDDPKNEIIQDLTWVAILKDYGKDVDGTIPKPDGYDASKYFCCSTDATCNDKPWNGDKIKMLNYGKLPRSPGATTDKYMINWPAHGNDYYLNVIENSWSERQMAYAKAKNHTRGFVYFMQTELGLKNLGLADDELNNGMALIPYNREGRRLKGIVRLDINHIKRPYDYTLYRTGISVGDYPVDHHHAKYPGKLPQLEFPPIPSFNIPLGALIPEKIDGLIVCEKGISVSNIVNGTTRLQPVVLLTGQAAGVLAALSTQSKKQPRQIPVRAVQADLLKTKCYIMPFLDVKPGDPDWEAIQRVGATGILKGVGKSEAWANKTYFYPDSLVNPFEFGRGLRNFARPHFLTQRLIGPNVIIANAYNTLQRMPEVYKKEGFKFSKGPDKLGESWQAWGLSGFDPNREITRRELAVMLDKCIFLFGNKNLPIDLNGIISFKYSEF